ncbi:MAG: hypothetical protein J5809_02425 [Selenomonadaceae bacterium]|nr:hypothetical protein [Selenomonadaceae bacterium]
MPTINAIANQATMIAGLSNRLFDGDVNAARNSALVGGVYGTLSNAINSEFGGQPTLNNLIENYRERRESFQEELRENMDSLRNSTDRLRESTQAEENSTTTATAATNAADRNTGSTLSTLTEFARGNIPPQELNFITAARATEQRTERTTENDERTNAVAEENRAAANPLNNLNDFALNYLTAETEEVEDVEEINAVVRDTAEDTRLNSVRNLVRDYNATVNYLNENRGVSNRMNALANNFRNGAALNESLRNIGISVNTTGELTINEAALNLALDNNSEGVNEILGGGGLAGQLERDINRANAQGERLFPNIVDFAREQQEDTAESLYTARTQNTAAYAWENTSRLLGAMFT